MNKSKTFVPNPEMSHSMVHYLLTIHKLKESLGYARNTDIAKELNLTKGSVSIAINNLKKKGFVVEEDNSKFLKLTAKAHSEVHQILTSRTLLFYFLKDFVGVDPSTAENEACQMEHLMSEETSLKFFKFMKKLACGCEDAKKADIPLGFNFTTTLDLCRFETVEQLKEIQTGDGQLIEKSVCEAPDS